MTRIRLKRKERDGTMRRLIERLMALLPGRADEAAREKIAELARGMVTAKERIEELQEDNARMHQQVAEKDFRLRELEELTAGMVMEDAAREQRLRDLESEMAHVLMQTSKGDN